MNSTSDTQPFVLNNLVERVEELFSEIDNDIAMYLLHSNEEYSKANVFSRSKITNIMPILFNSKVCTNYSLVSISIMEMTGLILGIFVNPIDISYGFWYIKNIMNLEDYRMRCKA